MKVPNFGMQACGNVIIVIGQHGNLVFHRSMLCMRFTRILGMWALAILSFCFFHYLEIVNQSIKPALARFAYIIRESSICPSSSLAKTKNLSGGRCYGDSDSDGLYHSTYLYCPLVVSLILPHQVRSPVCLWINVLLLFSFILRMAIYLRPKTDVCTVK